MKMKNADSPKSSIDSLVPADNDGIFVRVRRQWNDRRIGKVRLTDLSGFHWSQFGGGQVHQFGGVAPQPFLHAYMLCTNLVDGEIGHACRHGPPPHKIKVCITKKDNRRGFPFLESLANPSHSIRSVFRKHKARIAQRVGGNKI